MRSAGEQAGASVETTPLWFDWEDHRSRHRQGKPFKGGSVPVIMVQELAADPKALEQFAADNKETVRSILDAARTHGLVAHRFFGSADGTKVLIVDEWPDRESFERFAAEQAPQIEPMFQAAGGSEISEPTYWRELSTYDAFGWGA